jgi:surface antigen
MARRIALCFAIVLLFAPFSASSQGNLSFKWAHSWGGNGAETGNGVATDSAGNVYVAGSTTSYGAGGQDVLLLKYDPLGHLMWARTWGGPSNDFADAVLVGIDGSIYAVGATDSYGAGRSDVLILKFDGNGNLLWSRTWGGGSFDAGYDLSFDQNGNLAIAAESYSYGNSVVLLKLSTDGTLVSSTTWKGPATYDSGYSITFDPTGDAIITGTSWDYSVYPNHNTILILKFDSAGRLIWNRNWAGPSEDEASGRKVVRTDALGNIFILGHTSASCDTSNFARCVFDMLLLKIDTNGNLLWARKWGGNGSESPGGLWLDANNQLDVAATTTSFNGGLRSALVQQYDGSGSVSASEVRSTSGLSGWNSLTANASGALVATGFGPNNGGIWQSTDIASVAASGSLSIPAGAIGNPAGSFKSPAGTVTTPSGVIDVGGGGTNALTTGFSIGGVPSVEIAPSFVVLPSPGSTGTLAVTNSGTANLTILDPPKFTGLNWFDFHTIAGGANPASPTCTNGTVVEPRASCEISITFANQPWTASAESTTLSLVDNAPDSPQTIPISGGAQLTTISPNPVHGSSEPQLLTLSGVDFQADALIQWQDLTSGGADKVVPLSQNPNQLAASMTFPDGTAAWQIRVTNPGGPPSNWFSFEVIGTKDLAYANEDDYPFPNAASAVADPYGFYFRECTSYIAWRMNERANTIDPAHPSFFNSMDKAICPGNSGCYWGAAYHWYDNALALGVSIDSTPRLGDIAQWTSGCGGKCSLGHVAYVEYVNSSNGDIIVSEYNYPELTNGINHQFNLRPIKAGSPYYPQNFIHMPYVKLSAADLEFGHQSRGSSTSKTVTVINPGSKLVQVTNVSVSGDQDFSVAADTCAGGISPGGYCTIKVSFAPEVTGPRNAVLIIEDSDELPLIQKVVLLGSGR